MEQQKIAPAIDPQLREIFNSLPMCVSMGGHTALREAIQKATAVIAEKKEPRR